MLCRGAKATSLASKVAEQFGGGGTGMSLRHASIAGADRTSEAAEPSAHPPPRIPPRVHRPVVRESDMRKFAGQVVIVMPRAAGISCFISSVILAVILAETTSPT